MPAVINFLPALIYMLFFPAIMLWATRDGEHSLKTDGLTMSWVIGSGIWLCLGLVITYVK